jgi:hypothetical protein
VTVLAAALHPVFELAVGLVEGTVGHRVSVLENGVGGRMAHQELVPGKADVDGHAIAIAVVEMVTGQLDHDVARDEALEQMLRNVS